MSADLPIKKKMSADLPIKKKMSTDSAVPVSKVKSLEAIFFIRQLNIFFFWLNMDLLPRLQHISSLSVLFCSILTRYILNTILTEFAPIDPEITAQCGHMYHLKCMYEWLERSGKCPVCAKVIYFFVLCYSMLHSFLYIQHDMCVPCLRCIVRARLFV